MKLLHSLALSIALLVGLWVYLSVGNPDFNLNPWIGFVAWAAFFAAGGANEGAKKSLATGLAAVLLTAVTLYGVQIMGGGLIAMIVLISVLGFILVAMADIPVLAYTPAAFLGAACFFGAGGKVDASIIFVLTSWIAGVGLGFVSEQFGKRMARTA